MKEKAGCSEVEVSQLMADTILPRLMSEMFDADSGWVRLEENSTHRKKRRTTFADVITIRHTCALRMRYVGGAPYFATMRITRAECWHSFPSTGFLQVTINTLDSKAHT
jgi:hypothetical protein